MIATLSAVGSVSASRSVRSGRFYCIYWHARARGWRSTKMHQLAILGKAGGNQTLCTAWPLAVARPNLDHSLPCRNVIWLINHETSYETVRGVALNMRR